MKQVLGYCLGFAIFIAGIPALMWLVSGMPALTDIPVGRLYLSALVAIAGLSLSVWSIVYMKRVGKGNPFDAMGHEVAPRTRHLMTDGPYKTSRNPMYMATTVLFLVMPLVLASPFSFLIMLLYIPLIAKRIKNEEKVLEEGLEGYREYKQKVRYKVIPFIW